MSIWGWAGPIGSGKTLTATKRALWLAWYRDALLMSNIKITPKGRHQPWMYHQLSVGENGLIPEELDQWIAYAREKGHGVVLLLDEVHVLWPSRSFQSFPVAVMWLLTQSRHLGVDMLYTVQWLEQVDATVRGLTEDITLCGAWPTPSIMRRERGKFPLMFYYRKWVPRGDKAKRTGGVTFWPFFKSDTKLYNTDEIVRPRRDLAKRAAQNEDFVSPPEIFKLEDVLMKPAE